MASAMGLFSYSPRLNCTIFFAFLFIIGFLLFELQVSSTTSAGNKVIIVSNDNSKKTGAADSPSAANPPGVLSSYICDQNGPPNNHSSMLHSYCSKVPIPLNGWTRAEKYNEADIGFLILPNSVFNHTDTTAIRDTWLARVTHKYFLSEKLYAWLPVTNISAGDDARMPDVKRVLSGLRSIYNQQKSFSKPHKWYYLGDCHTFINVPHVLKKLESYDYTKPFFLGSSSNTTTCLDSHGKKHEVNHSSTTTGVFISSKLLQSMISQLSADAGNATSQTIDDYSDAALTCLIHRSGVRLTNISGFWNLHSYRSMELNEKDEANFDPEPNNFHSISPDQMYDLDEFYSFLHIDRLVNDQNWPELTNYIRTFVASHYETLRIKRNTYPSAEVDPRTSTVQ